MWTKINKYLVWIIYLVISFVVLLNHELWKDEAHHWLLGRDSHSLWNLIYNSRYEGHPILWNLILLIMSKVSVNPFGVQLVHWMIAGISCWLLIFKSPFPKPIQFLLPFSYFFLYEYSVISRNYSLCVLLVFIICILLSKKKINFIYLGITLVLLANTHLFGLILAVGISLIIGYDQIQRNGFKSAISKNSVFVVICLSGFLLSVWQIIPPKDHFLTVHHNDAGLFSNFRMNKLLSIHLRGLLHFPNFTNDHLWNTNLFLDLMPTWLKGVISLIGWGIPAIVFRHNKRLLFLYYFTATTIAIFAYISPLHMVVRHCGFLFILAVISFWLKSSTVFSSSSKHHALSGSYWYLYPYLLLQIIASGILIYTDVKKPFSQSKNVIHFIRENGYDHLPVATTQNNGQALSAYLRKPVFYAERNEFGSFAIWNTSSFVLDKTLIIQSLNDFSEKHQEFLIATEYEFGPGMFDQCTKINLLKSFEKSMVSTENFRLYHVICQ